MLRKLTRGPSLEHSRYVGPPDTLSIDTTTGILYRHDGIRAGGHPASGIPVPPSPEEPGLFGLRNGRWVPLEVERKTDNTGPGPQELIAGTLNAGFYGLVSPSELFYGDDLALEVGLSAGTAINNDSDWLKFAHLGKTLFVAMRPLRDGVLWSDLYQAGLVYGTDDDGLFPHPVDSPVNQLTIVEKGQTAFKVRLLKGANGDPTDFSGLSTVGNEYTVGSEWNELLYRVCSVTASNQVGLNWAAFSYAELGLTNNTNSWCQESIFNGLQRIGRRYLEGIISISIYGSVSRWRPALELTDITSLLFPIAEVGYVTTGHPSPVSAIKTSTNYPIKPLHMSHTTDHFQPISGVRAVIDSED